MIGMVSHYHIEDLSGELVSHLKVDCIVAPAAVTSGHALFEQVTVEPIADSLLQ